MTHGAEGNNVPVAPNQTMIKFGYPNTLIAETGSWAVLLRPQQVTLGSLVLACREPDTKAFSDLSEAAFAELRTVVRSTEALLRGFVQYQKINYLMLMMVDPDVHFHVFPRYEGKRQFAELDFPDRGWPGPPALADALAPDEAKTRLLLDALRAAWRG
jgi:diadenosine tetraphosphate (Ap4A) HIT family hydrolase